MEAEIRINEKPGKARFCGNGGTGTSNIASIGVIVNPRSHRNRHRAGYGSGSGDPSLVVRAESRAELSAALAAFARAEVGTVVVDGGDGTVRDVLTELPVAFGPALPALALIPSGKTNLIARDVGALSCKGDGVDRLRAAIAGTRQLRCTLRPALQVSGLQTGEPTLCGMLFGAAAFTRATALANESLHPRGIHHSAAVALAIASFIARATLGAERRRLMAGEPMEIGIDGEPPLRGPRFLVMVTPLERLMLGLWPFAERGHGPLHWLGLKAPPNRLAGVIMHALRGKAPPWLAEAGHASGRANEVTLRLESSFILDGEIFQPGPEGVRLTPTPPIRFLST